MPQIVDPRPPVAVNFSHACQSMRIVNCTKYAKKLGFLYRVGMSRGLFSVLHPVQQDSYKGETFDERLDILLKEFKRHADFAISDSIFFPITIGTMVKDYKNHEVIEQHVQMTKETMEVLACSPDSETGEPVLLFFHKAEYDKYKFKDLIQVSNRSVKV